MSDSAGRRTAWGLALGFGLLSLPLFSRCYDHSAFTYAVVAEEGLRKDQQAAHPLYVPALRLAARAARAAGLKRPYLEVFQLLSLAGACAWLWASYRLCLRLSKDPWTSAWAALFLAVQQGPWTSAMLTKPYTWAAFFAVRAIDLALGGAGGLATGAALAAAAGLDAVNLCLLPCLGYWGMRSGKRGDPRWLAGFIAATAGLCALSLLAGRLPPSVESLYRSAHLQGDSLLFSRDLPRLARVYLETLARSAPTSVIVLPLAIWAAWPAAVFAAFSAAFLVVDAANGYVFAALFGLPPLLAALAKGRPLLRVLLPAATLAAAALSYWTAIGPLSKAELDPARVEGAFLAANLGAEDVLAIAGAPDWRVAYLFRDRFKMLRFDKGVAGVELFAAPSLDVEPASFEAVAAALRGGRAVWLAADSFFRPAGVLAEKDIDAYQSRVALELRRRFKLGSPRISPQAQYYYPVLFKAR